MCGIHGLFGPDLCAEEVARRAARMGRVSRHRGPDAQQERVYATAGGALALGLNRLAILDLETGMQPVETVEEGLAIVCNGQIYNYVELRADLAPERFSTRGDIEVALRLYRRDGLDFLHALNGMYAGAIYDPRAEHLVIFRDRFGIKPLYFATPGGRLVFASEVKSLFASGLVTPELNRDRVATYLAYRYVPGKETLFSGVYCLPPGSFMVYDLRSGRMRIERYWSYQIDRPEQCVTLHEAEEEFDRLLRDAVRIRLRSDVEVGTLLSGGLDSTAITALTARHLPALKTFTARFPQPEYDEGDRVAAFLRHAPATMSDVQSYSQEVGRQAIEELPSIAYHVDEPIALGTVVSSNQICALAGSHLKVVITGEGADEVFGGYRKLVLEEVAARHPEMSPAQRRAAHLQFPELERYLAVRSADPVERYLQTDQLFSTEEIATLLGTRGASLLARDALPTLSGSESALGAMQRLDCHMRLPDSVLINLDRMTMRHSLEARTPFLDVRLVEFAATLPDALKVRPEGALEKWICRHSFAKRDRVDPDTVARRKQPFSAPWAHWLVDRTAHPPFLREILEGDQIARQGVLDPGVVRSLQSRVTAEGINPSTLVSESDRLYAVCMFSLWYQAYFEERRFEV